MADVTAEMSSEAHGDYHSRAIGHALTSLGYEHFKPAQEQVLYHFLAGKDVFVNLPTGYGKSVIYEAAPLCKDFLTGRNSLAVVVSPLVSLMEDQKARLEARSLNVVYLGKLPSFLPVRRHC